MIASAFFEKPFRVRCRSCAQVGLFATCDGIVACGWKVRLFVIKENFRGGAIFSGECVRCEEQRTQVSV